MASKGPVPKHRRAHRIGGWLPHDPKLIKRFVDDVVRRATQAVAKDLSPPVQALSQLYYNNPIVYMLFNQMLSEVPNKPPYDKDPSLQPEIRDVETLLITIDYQIEHYITYNDSPQIGTPINAILDWPMGTKAGFAAFLRDDVNACFEKILKYWADYLQDENRDSIASVITSQGGWISDAAQNDPNSPGLKDFLNTYKVPDPHDIHYGFKTWDQFFTRHFKDGLRYVDEECKTHPNYITSVAESTPFYIQRDVKKRDQFWAKDQYYSLAAMLGDDKMADKFVGGTAYQAFLSADSYHNWHAPVDGAYVGEPKILPGTYYSEPLLWGFDPDKDQKDPATPDAGADARSQGYIANVAKRGVAYIQPNDTSLGLIALVMIGMAEVSSIHFDDKPEGFIKGDEIGRFHFGGSTHVLIFGPGVTFTPEDYAIPKDPTHNVLDQPPVKVLSKLGVLEPKTP